MKLKELLNKKLKGGEGLKKLIKKESKDEDIDIFSIDNLTEESIMENLDAIREKISFYRAYPDLFVDDIKSADSVFEFRFSQRVFLRTVMRHKFVYMTATRGYSKSFLSMMALMLKAILYPGSKLFVTTGGNLEIADY